MRAQIDASDVWGCGGFYLSIDLVIGAAGYVDLSVAGVPEPSTWVLLGVGSLGLGVLGLRRLTPARGVTG